MKNKTLSKIIDISLFVFVIMFLIAECLINLTPPITRDSIIHHLAIPKLWLKHGGFYETPWADFSYYPMYINLLYLIPLYFKNYTIPAFIHMAFGIGTGWLIYLYLKKRFNRNWGLLGFFIFFSTPIVIWLSTSAYIDLGAAFFSTASIISFIKWRDTGYNSLKWLFISSFCMGIAIGSKYNILVAWFIVNLMTMVIYVQDTNKQMVALKYGAIFFSISLIVASPWFIKNLVLTGDPFYPLFQGFFKILQSEGPIKEIAAQEIVKNYNGQVGFFKMRSLLYGENFLETLAIPIRMFFQGEDNSYQYFQGRLNPILIIFLPFAFLKRNYGKDKLLFIIFSVFFIFIAFFLTEKQVRYLLPVIPFLTILSVTGIKNIYDAFMINDSLSYKITKCVLYFSLLMLLIPNFIYLREHFNKIRPLPFIINRESRDEFLTRHLMDYEAVKFVNTNLPQDAVVYTIYLGRRGFYLERNYRNDPSFGTEVLRRLAESSISDDNFLKETLSLCTTHILMRTDLVDRFLQLNYSKEEIARLLNMVKKHWKQLYFKNGFAVWEIENTEIRRQNTE